MILSLLAEELPPTGLVQGGFIGTLVFVVLVFVGALKWLYDRMATANKEMIQSNQVIAEKLIATFQSEQKYEREQCAKQFETMVSTVQKTQDAILAAINRTQR